MLMLNVVYVELSVLTESSAMDMIMLTLQNAREREEDDWKKLFAQADERFELVSITRAAKDSAAAIIVAEWKP